MARSGPGTLDQAAVGSELIGLGERNRELKAMTDDTGGIPVVERVT